MIDYLDTPIPYIIGISENIWNKIFMSKWNQISDDTVAFYVETSLLMTKVDLPAAPEPMTSVLTSTLEDIYNRQNFLNEIELKILLKQAFFNYLMLLINDFRSFFKVKYEGGDTDATTPKGKGALSPMMPVEQIF